MLDMPYPSARAGSSAYRTWDYDDDIQDKFMHAIRGYVNDDGDEYFEQGFEIVDSHRLNGPIKLV